MMKKKKKKKGEFNIMSPDIQLLLHHQRKEKKFLIDDEYLFIFTQNPQKVKDLNRHSKNTKSVFGQKSQINQ